MRTMFNCEQFACELQVSDVTQVIELDLEKNYFTPYGLFLPLYAAGNLLIRALRGEFKANELLKTLVTSSFLHVNHLGDVYLVGTTTEYNEIVMRQITSKDWITNGFRGNSKDTNIAHNYLLKGSKNIQTAIKRLDRIAYDGFVDPKVYNVKDVAERLKELGYTKPFFYTRFSDF